MVDSDRTPKRTTMVTIAYWAHGVIGAAFFLNGLDPQAVGLLLVFFPIITVIAGFFGLFSIPTAILTILLVAIYFPRHADPFIYAYIVAWIVIVGYRIFQFLVGQYDRMRRSRS